MEAGFRTFFEKVFCGPERLHSEAPGVKRYDLQRAPSICIIDATLLQVFFSFGWIAVKQFHRRAEKLCFSLTRTSRRSRKEVSGRVGKEELFRSASGDAAVCRRVHVQLDERRSPPSVGEFMTNSAGVAAIHGFMSKNSYEAEDTFSASRTDGYQRATCESSGHSAKRRPISLCSRG